MKYAIVAAALMLVYQLSCGGGMGPALRPRPTFHAPNVTVYDDGVFPAVTAAAVAEWNRQIGCDVLRAIDAPPANIVLWKDDGMIAAANVGKVQGQDRVIVGLASCTPERGCVLRFDMDNPHLKTSYCWQIAIAMHELGHALGLVHTLIGVMMPDIGVCEPGMEAAATTADAGSLELLQRYYCPEGAP